MVARVAVGYADLRRPLLVLFAVVVVVVVVVVVAAVEVQRGSVEVNALRAHTQALGGLAGDRDEHIGEIRFE